MSVGSYGGLPHPPPTGPTPRPAPPLPRPAPAREQVKFLTVAEIATRLRVSKMTVYRLIHFGDLVAVRVGRSFRVPERAYENYLRDSGAGDPA